MIKDNCVKLLIDSLDINIYEFCFKVNVSKVTVLNYINNTHYPHITVAFRILSYFKELGLDLTLDELYCLDDVSPKLKKLIHK